MKERPILFSAVMVRSILAEIKTRTRRVVKPKWLPLVEKVLEINGRWVWDTLDYELATPFGRPGDSLWVKEPLYSALRSCGTFGYRLTKYEADGKSVCKDGIKPEHWAWKRSYLPSIFMPRWASRINLSITNIRVERLQDITEEEACAEGVPPNWVGDLVGFDPDEHGYLDPKGYFASPEVELREGYFFTARAAFAAWWDWLNGKHGNGNTWANNPLVWVIEFPPYKKGETR